MCLREWCCKCLRGRQTPEEEETEETENPIPEVQEEGSEQVVDLYNTTSTTPVTPPRPNKRKLEAALKEAAAADDFNRQISSISEDSPEALRRQTVVFRSFQAKEKGERKRLRSSPGKLERAEFANSENTNPIKKVEEEPPIQTADKEKEQSVKAPNPSLKTLPGEIQETDLYYPDPDLHLSVVSLESEDPGRPVFELVPVQVNHQLNSPVDQRTQTELEEINVDCFVEEGAEGEEEAMGRLGNLKSRFTGSAKKDDRKFDPKRQVRNVHTAEQRESAVTNDKLNRPKNFAKTKHFKKTVPNKNNSSVEHGSESREKQKLLNTALLVGGGAGVVSAAFEGNNAGERVEESLEQVYGSQPNLRSRDPSRVSLTTAASYEWDPDYVSTLSGASFKVTGTGQTVSNVDRRGTIRGPCNVCEDCEQYEVEKGLSCEYCGCPPGKHKNIGHFNQVTKSMTDLKPSSVSEEPTQSFQHREAPTREVPSHHSTFREPGFSNSTAGSPRLNKDSGRGSGRGARKPLSVADVSALPSSMTLESAINFLTLERAESTDPVVRHSSSPDINRLTVERGRQPTEMSYRSDFSDFGSTAALGHSAYDGGAKKSVSPLPVSEDEFELPDSEELINQNTAKTLTFKQSPLESDLRIIPLNEEGIIRGIVKESVSLKVDIIPRNIRKQHVTWLHNHKKISPRYRVRFVDDRREVHIVSLRKKDAGIYTCQIKHNDGSGTKTTACTMILDVQVPQFVPKDFRWSEEAQSGSGQIQIPKSAPAKPRAALMVNSHPSTSAIRKRGLSSSKSNVKEIGGFDNEVEDHEVDDGGDD